MFGGGGADGGGGGGAYGDTPGEPGTESQLAEPRDLGGGGGITGLLGAFTTGGSGRSNSTPVGCIPASRARARASSCAWARRSAVWSAITRCLSAVSRHFSHVQYRYLQYRLWPFSSTLRRWLRQRAQLGGARGTPELEVPGSERSSQSSGARRLHAPTDTMAGRASAVFAESARVSRRAVTERLRRGAPPRARRATTLHLLRCDASVQFLAL